jgi:uncharacterized protein (UPF0332 family)
MQKNINNPKKEAPKESVLSDMNVSPGIKKKMEKLKTTVDKFKKEILKKFDKYIVGIELLPPVKEDKNRRNINILVLVDDSDSKKLSKEELVAKLEKIMDETALKIDNFIRPRTILVSELKEACFDGKYELLEMIALGAIVYDRGMLSALKISEIHKNMAIKKFEKYIVSYVAAGSLFRGDSSPNDIDVYVVVDDTDVKKMSRTELKDKLRAIIAGMGFEATKLTGIQASFHVQTYILTDFWDSIKDANPVIFTLLRDGVPLYDRGVFMPWKLLLQMGKIKPSPEAIDMNLDIGEKLLERVKQKLLSVVGEDLYYAALNPSQAALMLYGLPPPTPKETVKLFEEVFVKKEKLLEKRYVNILEKVRVAYKDIEHGKIKKIKGKEIDSLLKLVEDYLKRIQKLFIQIEKINEMKKAEEIHDSCCAVVRDALRMVTDKKIYDLEKGFKELLVDEGKVPKTSLKIFKSVMKLDSEFKIKKLTKQELEKLRRDSYQFIKLMVDFIQRSRGMELERAKIRFKVGNKYGEVLLLDNIAFIIPDLEKKEEVQKAHLGKKGELTNIGKSSLEELEKHLVDSKIPERVFIKEKTFSELKKLFGKNIEILITY